MGSRDPTAATAGVGGLSLETLRRCPGGDGKEELEEGFQRLELTEHNPPCISSTTSSRTAELGAGHWDRGHGPRARAATRQKGPWAGSQAWASGLACC